MPYHKRFTVLVGNYGSGKTELALAMALKLRQQASGRVALVDLDIVNPYFRSAEKGELLKSKGVEVFMPSFAMSTVDIPALPAQIQAVFAQDFEHVVIDVGGDDTGATALGMYAPFIAPVRADMAMLYVVNCYRPLSGTAEDIVALYRLIQNKSRQTPDALVNNGNLQEHTTAADLISAQETVEQAAKALGVPVAMVSGMEKLRNELPQAMRDKYFAFEPMMKPAWLVDGE